MCPYCGRVYDSVCTSCGGPYCGRHPLCNGHCPVCGKVTTGTYSAKATARKTRKKKSDDSPQEAATIQYIPQCGMCSSNLANRDQAHHWCPRCSVTQEDRRRLDNAKRLQQEQAEIERQRQIQERIANFKPSVSLPLAKIEGPCISIHEPKAIVPIDLNHPDGTLHIIDLEDTSLDTLANLVKLLEMQGQTDQCLQQLSKMTLGGKQLRLLYEALCKDPAAKELACSNYQDVLEKFRKTCKALKKEIQSKLQVGISRVSTGKPVTQKAEMVLEGGTDKPYYDHPIPLLTDSPVCILDLTGKPDFLGAMLTCSTIREILSQRNLKTGEPVRHITVLNFDECSFFAINVKDANSGTTRIVWPLDIPHSDGDKASVTLRVIDMTYTDIWRLISQSLLPDQTKKKFTKPGMTDSELATAMLETLKGDDQAIANLKKLTVPLPYMACSFLRGVRIKNGVLELEDGWYLSAQGRKMFELRTHTVNVFECVAFVLSVLFIAEPRHAQGMWPSTVWALEQIVNKRMTFSGLFGSLGGLLKGRLLPGANSLGSVLKKITMKPDQVIIEKPLLGQVQDAHTNALDLASGRGEVPNLVNYCTDSDRQPKRLAMFIVDSPVYDEDDDREFLFSCKNVIQFDLVKMPICQPMHKVLLFTLLKLLDSNYGPLAALTSEDVDSRDADANHDDHVDDL